MTGEELPGWTGHMSFEGGPLWRSRCVESWTASQNDGDNFPNISNLDIWNTFREHKSASPHFFLVFELPDQNSYVAKWPVGAGRRGAIKRTIKSSEGRLPKNGDECQVQSVNRFLLPSRWWVAVLCAWKGPNEHTRFARLRSFDQNFQITQDVTPIVYVQGLDTARELLKRKLDKLTSWDVVLFHVPDWLVGSCWTAGVLHYLFGRPKIMWIFWSMQHAPLVWIMGHFVQCLAIWPVNLQKLSKVESFSCHQHSERCFECDMPCLPWACRQGNFELGPRSRL